MFSRSVIKVAEGFSVTLHLLALNRTCALIKKINKNNINSKFFSKILPKLIAKILIFLLFKLAPSFNCALKQTLAFIRSFSKKIVRLFALGAESERWIGHVQILLEKTIFIFNWWCRSQSYCYFQDLPMVNFFNSYCLNILIFQCRTLYIAPELIVPRDQVTLE